MIRGARAWAYGRRLSLAAMVGATVAGVAAPRQAAAEVRREGDWAADPEVTLDLDNVPRAEAINRLATAAGWSVVLNAPKGDPVSVHVKALPASKLLEVLLADSRYVARRDGKLVSIGPDNSPVLPALPALPPIPPVPPVPAVPPIPAVPPVPSIPQFPPHVTIDSDDDDDGHDRVVTGGSLRIGPGETVHDVTVMGGNLDVWGTVTGDLAVMGGSVRIHKGAYVHGDASALGGALTIESGASVDGDVGVLGGVLKREDGAHIGGEVHEGIHKERHHHHGKARAERPERPERPEKPAKAEKADRVVTSSGPGLARRAADALNGAALLFVFGAVLLALQPERMDRLKLQIASRPMRSFAMGVVSVVAGAVLIAAACLTVIGIPFVVVGLLAGILFTLAALCSVLETVGGALLAHRTKNPYVHLAVGGLVFLILGAIPVVGDFIKLAAVLTAFGAVVSTRAAGLVPERSRSGSPYRQNATT